MDWARVWIQFTRIINFISNVGDTIIFMIASRMVRDTDEFRRRTLSRILAKGFLIFDIFVTFVFVFLAAFVLNKSEHEMPTMPLRLWIIVFIFYCMIHIVFSMVQYRGGPWSHVGFAIFRDLEYKKNVFGIFWWGLGMYFMWNGADQMSIAAPNLTWILTFFLCFDIGLAICCMLMLFTVFIVICACIPILIATFYYMRYQQNRRRLQLPPCPWCHK